MLSCSTASTNLVRSGLDKRRLGKRTPTGRRVRVANAGSIEDAVLRPQKKSGDIEKESRLFASSTAAATVLLSTAPAAGASEQVFDVAEAAPAWATYLCIAVFLGVMGQIYLKSVFGPTLASIFGNKCTASHILVDSKSQANEIKDRLVEGPASTLVDRFAKEAQSYSKCPSKAKGGSLGEFAKGTMVPEFDEIAFSAPVGTLQGPISTRFGYHLIIVTDRPDKN